MSKEDTATSAPTRRVQSQTGWRDAQPEADLRRKLSRVLLTVTLSLAFVLGVLAALLQLWIDLNQQKAAVEVAAEDFLTSVAPSAESAAYNYQNEAAAEVARGLFSQRAVKRVRIVNDGETMIDEARTVDPTLPRIARLTREDDITLTQSLFAPSANAVRQRIGSISVTIDRSIVSPSFVDRMMSYFALALIKNFAFGILLVLVIYGALARHLVRLVDVVADWRPDHDKLTTPRPPRFLQGTEIEVLGRRIESLADSAMEVIRLKSRREVELSQRSEELHEMVLMRTSELERANSRLEEMARRDALTDLLNRGGLDQEMSERFETAGDAGEEVAFALLDIDNFKAFNDHYGHQAGDRCITQIAGCIGEVAAESGCVAGRYGGEEFGVFIAGCGVDDMVEIGQRIHRKVRDLAIAHARSTTTDVVTISIGVAGALASDASLETLVGQADRALYDAKEQGRNRTCVFAASSVHRRRSRTHAPLDMRAAIEERSFEPFYQPQFDALTGDIVGMEVLARLAMADGTFAVPPMFLPTLGELGLLTALDRIMAEKSRDMLTRASRRGIVIPRLSINVHADGLRDQSLCAGLVDLAARGETVIAAELLETWNIDHVDEGVRWSLDALKDAGVEIEIDDFGTGHASLLAVHRLRPNRLKIAKEIVFPILNSVEYRMSVESILRLADTMGVSVVAEGVETEAHARVLIDTGCTIHQGFFYARALSEDDVFAILESNARTPHTAAEGIA